MDLLDVLEAKATASQLRITNFYKDSTGKMVPETFPCIKDSKRNTAFHRLEQKGRTINNPEEIVEVMQRWYKHTAAPPQLVTLDQFLQEQNTQLPQLSAEACSNLRRRSSGCKKFSRTSVRPKHSLPQGPWAKSSPSSSTQPTRLCPSPIQ